MVSEQDCLFCKIIRNEIPAKKVYEDGDTLAILDINPASRGHTLVMTKRHAELIFDVNERDLEAAIAAVKKVSEKIHDELKPEGINVLQNNGRAAGQLVGHLHFHVIPRYQDDKIVIMFPREPAKDLDAVHKTLTEEKRIPRPDEFEF